MAKRQAIQDFSAGTILMSVVGCLFTISQLIVFVATVIQLWCITDQLDDNPNSSSKTKSKTDPIPPPKKLTSTSIGDTDQSVQSPPKTKNDNLVPMQTSLQNNRYRSDSNTTDTRNRARKNSKKKSRKPIHIFFRISTSIASFWFTICALGSSIDNLFYSMPFIPSKYAENSLLLGVSAALTSYLGRITMSVVFIGRLYFVFKDSAMPYPKYVLWSLIILTMLSFILFALAGFIFLEVSSYEDDSVHMFIISNVFDICFSVLLVYLFLHKLFKVLRLCSTGENSKINQNLMKIMTKYSLLVTFALGSTSLSIIYGCIAFQSDEKLSVYNGYEFTLTIDSFINGFALYLNYPFGSQLYNKVCKYFDGCCRKVCRKIS